MKKIDLPTSQIDKFAGKWIAIDSKHDKIIAVAEKLEDLAPLVSGKVGEEKKIRAAAFLVPRKDEGPYILIS